MRYQIGQVIPVVKFKVKFPNGNIGWVSWFLPWESEILEISIKNLTVIEHHKVPSSDEPDGEKNYDGFVLKDNEGRIWHNQFPHASYGQISDESNRLFDPAWDVSDDELHEFYNMKLLTEYLAKVQKGINDFSKMEGREKEKESLENHFNEVNAKFKELTGKNIVVIPLVFGRTDSAVGEYYEDILIGYIEGEIPENNKLEGAINRTKHPREVQ